MKKRAMEAKELLRKLDLHMLRCLCVLIAESHVSRAADLLGISQPTMSSILAQLREVFNDPLLVRTNKGMAPTANALSIAASANVALELMEQSLALTRDFQPAKAETTFHISASESVGFMFAPQLTRALEDLAPSVRVSISPSDGGRLWEKLEEGEVDLVISFQPQAPDSIYAVTLYEQPLCVIASGAHPRIRGSLTLDRFLAERHVVYRPPRTYSTIERRVDEACTACGRQRRVAISVPSALAAPPIVAASSHLTTLTLAVAEYAAKINDLQILEPPLDLGPVRVSLFWHGRTHASSAHRWFRQTIRDLFH